MKKDAFYFSHDYNARYDDKIKRLIRRHGMLGYGVFWAIIEDLYNNSNAMRTDYDSISYDLRVDKKIIESVINDFDLFQITDQSFGSLSIQRRLDEREEKSNKARKSANYRWSSMRTQCERTDDQCERNAIKEIKEKEIKEKESERETESLSPNSFRYFLKNKCPYLSDPQNIKQLSKEQYDELVQKYGDELIRKISLKIENRDDLRRRYNDLFTTLDSWAEKEKGETVGKPYSRPWG